MQTDAMHPLHPRHGIVVAAPNRLRTLGVRLDLEVHRQKRRRPMMLRPVELNATANPRSSQADQRGLDDRLAIDDVVTVALVLQHVNPASQLRQDHHPNELVLQPDRLPPALDRPFRDSVGEG